MKLKVIENENHNDFEEGVNDFFHNRQIINIQYQCDDGWHIAYIHYEEKQENRGYKPIDTNKDGDDREPDGIVSLF